MITIESPLWADDNDTSHFPFSMGDIILHLRLCQTPPSSELSSAHTSSWETIAMLSALKKLVGSESGQLRERHIPAGMQSMNQSLQRRFAKGVQYNSEEFLQPLMRTCEFLAKMSSHWEAASSHQALPAALLVTREWICNRCVFFLWHILFRSRQNDWKESVYMGELDCDIQGRYRAVFV